MTLAGYLSEGGGLGEGEGGRGEGKTVRMIRNNGNVGGQRVYEVIDAFTACHVTRTALFPSPPTVIVAHDIKTMPWTDARMSGKGAQCPGAKGMTRRAVKGLKMTREGEI